MGGGGEPGMGGGEPHKPGWGTHIMELNNRRPGLPLARA